MHLWWEKTDNQILSNLTNYSFKQVLEIDVRVQLVKRKRVFGKCGVSIALASREDARAHTGDETGTQQQGNLSTWESLGFMTQGFPVLNRSVHTPGLGWLRMGWIMA